MDTKQMMTICSDSNNPYPQFNSGYLQAIFPDTNTELLTYL